MPRRCRRLVSVLAISVALFGAAAAEERKTGQTNAPGAVSDLPGAPDAIGPAEPATPGSPPLEITPGPKSDKPENARVPDRRMYSTGPAPGLDLR